MDDLSMLTYQKKTCQVSDMNISLNKIFANLTGLRSFYIIFHSNASTTNN